jgi:hypothetical protein
MVLQIAPQKWFEHFLPKDKRVDVAGAYVQRVIQEAHRPPSADAQLAVPDIHAAPLESCRKYDTQVELCKARSKECCFDAKKCGRTHASVVCKKILRATDSASEFCDWFLNDHLQLWKPLPLKAGPKKSQKSTSQKTHQPSQPPPRVNANSFAALDDDEEKSPRPQERKHSSKPDAPNHSMPSPPADLSLPMNLSGGDVYVTSRPEATAELVISETVDAKLMEKNPTKANPLCKGNEQWMREPKFWQAAHNATVRLRRDLYPDARMQPKYPIVNAVLMKNLEVGDRFVDTTSGVPRPRSCPLVSRSHFSNQPTLASAACGPTLRAGGPYSR